MFPLIEVSGSARERGQQHGLKARLRTERSIATYARLFAYCGIDWQRARHLGAAYRGVIGDLDADLLSEIEGIASGSGRSVDEILALDARTEILPPSYPGEPRAERSRIAAANAQDGVPDLGECTAVAVKPARTRASSPPRTCSACCATKPMATSRSAAVLTRPLQRRSASKPSPRW